MVSVTIDGLECYLDSSQTISLSYNSAKMADPQSAREADVVEFRLPLCPQNLAILGAEGDVHPSTKFNSQWHPMVISKSGCALFDGTAYLTGVEWGSDEERYATVECRGGASSWAELAATTLFRNIAIEWSSHLSTTAIKESWLDEESPIKFFAIERDSYTPTESGVSVSGVRVVRSIDDYHPFISVSELLYAIFTQAGYTIESSLLEGEFKELYMSGRYSAEDDDSSAALEAMGFYLKRLEDGEATTDDLGRLSLSPHEVYATLGNVVDLESVESDSECYNRGGVIQKSGEAITFVPLTQIDAGFEYYLHYICQAQIESRSTLKGINELNIVSGETIEWELTNNYLDQRDELVVGVSYKIVVFDFEQGDTFRLIATTDQGQSEVVAITERMTSFTPTQQYSQYTLQKLVSSSSSRVEVELDEDELGDEVLPDEQTDEQTDEGDDAGGLSDDAADPGSYQSSQLDWAIYWGYVEESSAIEVEVRIRTAPETYSPTSPMEFEFVLLQGGLPQSEFTLLAGSSLKPYFSSYPGYNSQLAFEDVAQHSIYAIELLEALQHLFNLRFSSCEESKVVTIEPFDTLYDHDDEWDWTHKLRLDEGVSMSDYAQTTHRQTTYGYQQTDGVVERLGQSDNAYFGQWSCTVDSYLAESSDQTLLNPIFCATTNDPDEGVLLVGDRDDIETTGSLDFSPRIVRYFGLRESEQTNYSLPYASFFSTDEGYSLCFEDRDGLEGLNRYLTNQLELLQRSQMIRVPLSLTALDYHNIINPTEGAASHRSTFRFDICGESFRAILRSVESYNIDSGEAWCQFVTVD